jgi:hypothetical protein
MGILYIATTGNAANSGTSDNDAADLTGAAATVAGSVITLDGSPDLSSVVTSGASQSAIALGDATNTNQKIFWITAVDNGADTVTVVGSPTVAGSSTWRIGGRMVHTPANIEAALRAGDIVQFNDSPASSASTLLTCRAAGNATDGFITVRGKSGVRPTLTHSSTANVITPNSNAWWKISNLEIVQSGGVGSAALACFGGWLFENLKISDAGAVALSITAGGTRVIGCDIGGGSITDGIATTTGVQATIIGNYIHDVADTGIELVGAAMNGTLIAHNVIDTCAGRGVYLSSSSVSLSAMGVIMLNNTIHGCGNSGLEITDADAGVILLNNIFSENGNAAGEYNVEWVAGAAERVGYHAYNCFYHSGGGGGANLSGLTANSTETTSDPLFTNAGSGDFSLGSSSPCKATGFPGQLLNGSLGYLDMGAIQRQEAGGSSLQRVIGG